MVGVFDAQIYQVPEFTLAQRRRSAQGPRSSDAGLPCTPFYPGWLKLPQTMLSGPALLSGEGAAQLDDYLHLLNIE